MPCEKNHIRHEILQHGLTKDIAEQTLGKNRTLCETQRKLSRDYFRRQKYDRKPILVG